MSAISKIQELKSIVTEQNVLLATQNKRMEEVSTALRKVYAGVVDYKVHFSTGTTAYESGTYPSVRREDLVNSTPLQLANSINLVFNVVTSSLDETRNGLKEFHAEFDEDLEREIDNFRNQQRQIDGERKTLAFREDLRQNALSGRPDTPPQSQPSSSPDRFVKTVVPPLVTADNKTDKDKTSSSKPKSSTTTLGNLVKSPTNESHKKK